MTDRLKARDAGDVNDAIRWALSERKALEIAGQGTRAAIGRPAQTDLTIDLSGLSGVTLYEPEELVLTARAGTPIAEIETLVNAKGQQLAFEPMDCGPLFGGRAGRGTIGGALTTNLSGPRRLEAGAARDHLLGMSAVSGRGETFKSGGRVVKNVTGYDLCKLVSGSWGTLAVMTEVTLKVLPKPEFESTVLLRGLEPVAAVQAMTAAMGLACDVSGAAHLPAAAAERLTIAGVVASGHTLTALRLEGVAPSVAHRKTALFAAMRPFGAVGYCEDLVSRALWRSVRDVTAFAASRTGADRPVWRVSTAPAQGAALARRIAGATGADTEVILDWAGGLLWVMLARTDDAGVAAVRRAVAACGGHATLIRAAAPVRAVVDVFQPQDANLAALTKRVKAAFDPHGVLNPGRMWAGV